MAGKALCQDPSKAAGKIKTKSLRKRRLFSMEWFPTGRGALALRPSQGLAPSEGCFRPPQGLAPLCKGSWQGRQAMTEGLWVSCRNGLPITGDLLLYLTYNPSASHPLSTSPYTGEARGGGTQLARTTLPGAKGWWEKAKPRGRRGAGVCLLSPSPAGLASL